MAAFSIFIVDEADTPIAGASAAIFSANGIPIMSALSDVDGAVLLTTNEAQITLVVSKSGYSFSDRLYLEPEEGAVFDVQGSALTINPPEDASKCRVYGRILDPLSKVLSSKWKFTLNIISQMGSETSDDIITYTSKLGHEDGFIIMDLLRGAEYALSPLPICNSIASGDDYDKLERVAFKVPNQSTAKLIDLISPRVKQVTLITNSVTISVGEDIKIDVEVLLTNGEIAENSAEYISTLLADIDNLNVSVEKDHIRVRGLVVGQTTVAILSTRSRTTAESMFYRPAPETLLHTITVEVQ